MVENFKNGTSFHIFEIFDPQIGVIMTKYGQKGSDFLYSEIKMLCTQKFAPRMISGWRIHK